MAIGPARHLEHAIRNMEPRPDIKLHHLALDIGQVLEEDFPRKIPTKREAEKERERLEDFRRAVAAGDTGAKKERLDGRKANFEARHGPGTVQLNALTSNPVRLEWFTNLLRTTVRALRDPDIEQKLRAGEAAAKEVVEQAGRIREIANRRLSALREEDLGLPEVEAEEDPEGTRGWLYDSGRPGASAGF
jgi:hypothetical protein